MWQQEYDLFGASVHLQQGAGCSWFTNSASYFGLEGIYCGHPVCGDPVRGERGILPPLKTVSLPVVDDSALANPDVRRAVQTLKNQPAKWIPVILKDRCTACGDCIQVCGPACLRPGRGAVVLSQPELCLGAGDCVAVCQDEAIQMTWVVVPGDGAGRWRLVDGERNVAVSAPSNCGKRPDKLGTGSVCNQP